MKKLLLASCLVVLCASSLKGEETQQQANWKENAAKYSKITAKVGFAGLCMYHLSKQRFFRNYIETVLTQNPASALERPFLNHFGRSNTIIFIAALTTIQSVINDLKK